MVHRSQPDGLADCFSVANSGYDKSEDNLFVSPHALRHWLALTLRDAPSPDSFRLGWALQLETNPKIFALPNMSPMADAIRQINRNEKKVRE
jgi:hypothetical protein